MAKMVPVCVDLETFWSPTHTLSKMNPIAYCTHRETEIISVAYKVGDAPTEVVFGEPEVKAWAQSVDWSDKLVYGHNLSHFDSMILRWRMGIRPKMWGCTLAMSRPYHSLTVGGSLAKLVEHYDLGKKDQTALHNTKGRHLKEFTPDEIAAMGEYNKMDVEQCAALFKILLPKTPKAEMKVIDATIRMLVEPKFRLDVPLLESTLAEERERKHNMLLETAKVLDVGALAQSDEEIAEEISKTLGSSAKFAKLLESLGVEVPMKVSPKTGKPSPALAKTDEAFVALVEHENPVVSAAAQARLGVKSTILESRIGTFLEVGRAAKGRMPVPLVYHAAHTARWGGGMSLNLQNLPRVSGKPTDALRNSLVAPPGYKVVVADLSGIELRVNHYLWQVPSSMALFDADPAKGDLYKDFASKLYGVPFAEVTKAQRQIGKVAHLGLGYGAGRVTFVRIAKLMGGVDISEEESQSIVASWRAAYKPIVDGWKACQKALNAIANGVSIEVDPWGMVTTDGEGYVLPSGRKIRYPDLRITVSEDGKKSWKYGTGRHETFLTGGKCDENLVQAISRDILVDNMLKIKQMTGHYPCHTVHDELIYVVPESEAESILDVVQNTMRTPPVWWPELKTWSEGDIADSYGAAK